MRPASFLLVDYCLMFTCLFAIRIDIDYFLLFVNNSIYLFNSQRYVLFDHPTHFPVSFIVLGAIILYFSICHQSIGKYW
nr:MAG TPA: hypothetical protein [Caudoviricetes sp.]